jgi:hypothetical protein
MMSAQRVVPLSLLRALLSATAWRDEAASQLGSVAACTYHQRLLNRSWHDTLIATAPAWKQQCFHTSTVLAMGKKGACVLIWGV